MDILLQIEKDITTFSSLVNQFGNRGSVCQGLHLKAPSEKKFKKQGIDLYASVADFEVGQIKSKSLELESLCTLPSGSLIKEIRKNDSNTEFIIKLKREKSFKTVIKCLCESKSKYGHVNHKKNGLVILNAAAKTLRGLSQEELKVNDSGFAELSLEDIRIITVTSHLKHLYEANGHICHILNKNHKEKLNLNQTTSDSHVIDTKLQKDAHDFPILENIFLKRCRKSQYRLTCNHETSDVGSNESECAIEIDLEKYLMDLQTNPGRHGFDKNIKCVKVLDEQNKIKPCLSEACQLECDIAKFGTHLETTKFTLLRVATLKLKWETEISSLVWKLFGDHSQELEKMMMCCSGPCSTAQNIKEDNHIQNFEQYLRLKCDEIREAYMTRYGAEVKGDEWEDTIRSVSLACIKFDILSSPLRNKISFRIIESDSESSSSRESLFVLYNYSRLCTLLRNFEKEVLKGNYQALPDVENVDFANLRKESEWRLFVKYILHFPILVNSIGRSLSEENGFHIHPSTNKVCSFLTSLGRDLSSYYHQTKVLLDPRPHLFPVMFARIYLIIAIKQVMLNAFELIGVTPPTQM